MKRLLTFVAGVGMPLILMVLVVRMLQPPPPDPPPPPEITDTAQTPSAPPPEGRWELDADASFVGYRIAERDLQRGRDGEAVGRTSAVEGAVEMEGGVVEEGSIEAGLRELSSDQRRRDRAIQVRYLESEAHPRARFTLREPFAVADGVPDGRAVTHRVAGTLEIRGIEREVVADLRVRWDGEEIAVVGAVPIELTDFDIRSPSILMFRQVEDQADLELDLRFSPNDP